MGTGKGRSLGKLALMFYEKFLTITDRLSRKLIANTIFALNFPSSFLSSNEASLEKGERDFFCLGCDWSFPSTPLPLGWAGMSLDGAQCHGLILHLFFLFFFFHSLSALRANHCDSRELGGGSRRDAGYSLVRRSRHPPTYRSGIGSRAAGRTRVNIP